MPQTSAFGAVADRPEFAIRAARIRAKLIKGFEKPVLITLDEMRRFSWDAFICHCTEDKIDVARPLGDLLAGHHLRIWIDEGEIRPGDSLREKIDEGLARSRFGVVIFSPHFLAKPWAKAELGAIFAREMTGQKTLVPVWHKVSSTDIADASPLLLDRLALRTEAGLDHVATEIARLVRREVHSYRPGRPLYAGRLTKKRFLSLPDGAFLLSNVLKSDYTPAIAEELPPREERETLWRKLAEAGITNRRFYVFESAAEYRAHMSARSIWIAKGS